MFHFRICTACINRLYHLVACVCAPLHYCLSRMSATLSILASFATVIGSSFGPPVENVVWIPAPCLSASEKLGPGAPALWTSERG